MTSILNIYRLVSILVFTLFLVACTTVESMQSAPEHKGDSKTYDYNIDDITTYTREAIVEMGLKIKETSSLPGGGVRFIAKKEFSLTDYGSFIRIIVKPDAYNQTRVSIYNQQALTISLPADENFSTSIYIRIYEKIALNKPANSGADLTQTRSLSNNRAKKTNEPPLKEGLYYGKYHALVIGNGDYEQLPKLKTAQHDAKVVADVLKNQYGYKVNLLLNASRKEILKAFSKYRNSLGKKDNMLIYYAGHGWLDKTANEGYWLPVDATRSDEVNWISTASITTAVRTMQANHVLIIADSCYSGKLARGLHIQKKEAGYLNRLYGKKARVVLSSGGLEPVADSGGQHGHSVFAWSFINALKENNSVITGTELFEKIRRPVVVNSNQTPEYADIRQAGHDGGDFLFINKNK